MQSGLTKVLKTDSVSRSNLIGHQFSNYPKTKGNNHMSNQSIIINRNLWIIKMVNNFTQGGILQLRNITKW